MQKHVPFLPVHALPQSPELSGKRGHFHKSMSVVMMEGSIIHLCSNYRRKFRSQTSRNIDR